MKKQWLWVLAVAMFCSLSGVMAADDSVRGSFDRTLTVSGPVDLGVETGSGSISVRAGDVGKVMIHGEIRGGSGTEQRVRELERNPPIEQNENTIRIRKPEQDGGFFGGGIGISYAIVVPAQTRLEARSGSGSEQITGIKGPVTAHTGSGSIRMSDIGGDVRAETGSGSMHLEDISGSVRANTGSGSIHADRLGGNNPNGARVSLETGSGGIDVRGVHGSLYAHTGSGHLTAEGEPNGGWNLQTGSGHMEVRVPANAAFDVRAHSGSGGITIDHPITVQGSVSKHNLEGKVRGGGPLLELGTGSGGIHIGSGGSGAAL